MDIKKKIKDKMHTVADAVTGLLELDFLPSFDSESLIGHLLIESGIDDTNTISICADCSVNSTIYADAHFTINEDSYTCRIDVFDREEQDIGVFVESGLVEHLRSHPTLGYKHNEEEGVNSYIDINVPNTQIVIAYIAVLMAIQEYINNKKLA